jgi:hypothetical protein
MNKMPVRWQIFQLFAWITAYSAVFGLSLLWGFLFILAIGSVIGLAFR